MNAVEVFDKIFQEREGKHQSDGSFMCLCPAHDDHNPSLHVSLVNGKLLAHCKVGCSQEAIITALRARNLWVNLPSDFKPTSHRTNSPQSTPTKKPLLTIPPEIPKTRNEKTRSRVWVYKDPAGKVLGYVARYDGQDKKEIIPYFNYKNSQWSPGAPKGPRPLYGLNFITRAPQDLTIWIVEGEKCAEALQSLPQGVRRLAITSLGGTNAAKFTDWSPLAGRKVRIWPDHDKPGKKYAEDVKLQLEGLMPPPTIEIVDTAKLGLKEKEDVYDWLQIHKPEELDRIPLTGKKKIKTDIRKILETEFKPEELILAPWLQTQGLCMIHSRPGVGKTFLAIGIAFAVAAGTKFLKWEVSQPRGVLYVDGEMAGNDIKGRYEKIVIEHGFALPSKPLEIITPDINPGELLPDIGTRAGQKIIENQIIDETELLILDNISCLQRTGDENPAEGWAIMQEWLLHLRSTGLAVLLIHHSGKGGSQRGTSKKEDFLNTILTLKRNPLYEFEEGARFEVHYEKARSVYGPAARPFEARLDIVEGVWTIKDLGMVTYDYVVKMINEDYKQADIAQMLGVSKAAISQHVKKAREKGDLLK